MTQMLTMIFWGRAADRWGRKPVLVSSLAGLSIAVSLFGVSKTIPQMILFRSSAGMFAGTIVTVRAMVTENSTAKTQARAFSFFAFAGNVGIFLGPLIGGGLSSPAVQYPRLFGWAALLKSYPYALPTFVCGSISLSAAVLCFLFIKETLVPEAAPGSGVKKATVPIKEILRAPGVLMVLYLFSHVNLLGLAYTAVMPVFWFTAPVWGGFGFSPFLISVFLAIAGASQAVWLLLIFPPLQHRFGTGGVLRGCATAWPVFFIISPVCSLLRRYGYERAFWTLGPVSLAVGSGVSMGFTGAQLALNDIAPSSATLGTLNALALTLASAIRMVAPALFSSIFAWGVRNQILMGYLIWVVLVAVAVALAVTVHWLPEKAEGRLKPRVEEEEHA
jgi:MFS family permease